MSLDHAFFVEPSSVQNQTFTLNEDMDEISDKKHSFYREFAKSVVDLLLVAN